MLLLVCSASLVMRNGGGERRGINSPGGVAGDAWRCPERMDASELGTTTSFGSRNMDRQTEEEGRERERPAIFWREKGILLQ